MDHLSLSQQGGNVVLVEYTEERPPLLPMAGMGSRLVTYYRRTAAEDAAADRRAGAATADDEGDGDADGDAEGRNSGVSAALSASMLEGGKDGEAAK